VTINATFFVPPFFSSAFSAPSLSVLSMYDGCQ
jgi:hypothetical protein